MIAAVVTAACALLAVGSWAGVRALRHRRRRDAASGERRRQPQPGRGAPRGRSRPRAHRAVDTGRDRQAPPKHPPNEPEPEPEPEPVFAAATCRAQDRGCGGCVAGTGACGRCDACTCTRDADDRPPHRPHQTLVQSLHVDGKRSIVRRNRSSLPVGDHALLCEHPSGARLERSRHHPSRRGDARRSAAPAHRRDDAAAHARRRRSCSTATPRPLPFVTSRRGGERSRSQRAATPSTPAGSICPPSGCKLVDTPELSCENPCEP